MVLRTGNPAIENVSPQELYDVICGAASQDPRQVQASTKRLKEMSEMFGTYDALHEIAATRSLPLSVRQQSIIQFKNTALAHWRSRRYLSDEQRVRIRGRCSAFLDEPDDTIAACNEVIVAKIARQDFPSNWPSLLSDLRTAINSHLQLWHASPDVDEKASRILFRSLRILNEIVKEFSTIKMIPGIKVMARLVEELHLELFGHYAKLASSYTSLNPSSINSRRLEKDLVLGHIVMKSLVKMLEEFFGNCAVQLQTLSEIRINLVMALPPSATQLLALDQLTRHVRLFGKFFRRLQQLAVQRFVGLPMSNDLVLYYWSKVVQAANSPSDFIADSPRAVFPVRFLVQALVLFKENLAQWTPVRKNGTVNENVLNREFVESAVGLLVTKFMLLNPSDLDSWMADPEEWVIVEDRENDQWEYEIRGCAERVLMALVAQYPQYVVPLLETTFNQVIGQPTVDLPSIIQKEAVYCAIGRCPTRLKDVIPFQQWLEHTLMAEARETNPNYPIIKHRIAWLIGKWVSELDLPLSNSAVWDVLTHLLQDRGPGGDPVVRLTAASALRECIDTQGFDADVFAPFLPIVVVELVKILAEADNLEGKRRIANSLNIVIERADRRIIPLIGVIAESLPRLWSEAEDDWAFKGSLLTTVEAMLKSSKESSVSLSGIVVALVRESFSPAAQLHLEEDGLNLWLTALQNTTTIESVGGTPGLLELFPTAVGLLAGNLEVLHKIISIIESYLLLDVNRILQLSAQDLFRAYSTAFAHAVTTNLKSMLMSFEMIFQLAPSQLWGEALHLSGLFGTLLQPLLDDNASDRNMFLRLMAAAAMSQNKPEPHVWESVLDQWMLRFDNMAEPRYRKLTAMAIANLVSSGRPEVLQRLAIEIFNLWIDVFAEMKEAREITSQEGVGSPLSLLWDQDEPPDSFFVGTENTAEHSRRKALLDNDPVRTVQLTSFIATRLQETEAAVGGGQVLQSTYLEKADPAVLKQIQSALTGGL
ncbi:hypothetical protein JAAARDRAFT_187954 [Jaapia argillacea MUCL 33604]|uniref:Importin N-terminal domain-containing protein n=1 Tax=Jaapia argillacea MUCL 33604 TaxID=933084 RepID=A0A067QCG0_9AGAM|nr:hypothetical protein JAAARDRAFT_187954 [Jaapia argillacea MUCL 33604]